MAELGSVPAAVVLSHRGREDRQIRNREEADQTEGDQNRDQGPEGKRECPTVGVEAAAPKEPVQTRPGAQCESRVEDRPNGMRRECSREVAMEERREAGRKTTSRTGSLKNDDARAGRQAELGMRSVAVGARGETEPDCGHECPRQKP